MQNVETEVLKLIMALQKLHQKVMYYTNRKIRLCAGNKMKDTGGLPQQERKKKLLMLGRRQVKYV